MTQPTLEVLLGSISGWTLGTSVLDTDTFLAGAVSYDIDITDRVQSISIRRGRSHELNRMEAGTAQVVLMNQDGAFNPWNTSSAFYGLIVPMTPIRIQATFSAVTYELFTGFIEAWPATWEGLPTMGRETVEIRAVDAFKIFNLASVTLARGVETTGQRITALLDLVGYTPTAIDTTETNIQASTATTTVLSHMQEVAASEGGVGFIAADGTATFFDRFHSVSLDEANDTWGTDEKRYASVTTTYDDSQLWNEVTVTANALADQTAADTVSQARYYLRSLSVSTSLTSTADMLERAESLLAKYSTPEFRVTSLVIDNASLDDAQWPRILMKDLHDRVQVRIRPAAETVEQPSYIEGISYQIGAGRWQVTWNLSSTLPQVGQWILGDATFGVLDTTTSLVNTI